MIANNNNNSNKKKKIDMEHRQQQLSIVHMNNNALTYFLFGDYDRAQGMLRVAYECCQQRLLLVNACEAKQILFTVDHSSSQTTHTIEYDGSENIEKKDYYCSWDDGYEDDDDDCYEADEADEVMMVEDSEGECSVNTIMPSHHEDSHQNLESRANQNERLDQDTDFHPTRTDTPNRPNNNDALPCCFASTSDSFSMYASSSFTLYNRALVLSRSDEQDTYLLRTSAIILYNLGLIQHNLGMHQGLSTAFRDALHLYEKALRILDKYLSKYQQSLPSTTLCYIWRILDVEKLLMALFNNMGNIHAHLFNMEKTNACMKSLRLVLEASNATTRLFATNNNNNNNINNNNSINNIAPAMDEDYVFFLLNSLFQGKELCLAPAA